MTETNQLKSRFTPADLKQRRQQLTADVSRYLAERFVADDVPFNECDSEAEAIVKMVYDEIRETFLQLPLPLDRLTIMMMHRSDYGMRGIEINEGIDCLMDDDTFRELIEIFGKTEPEIKAALARSKERQKVG